MDVLTLCLLLLLLPLPQLTSPLVPLFPKALPLSLSPSHTYSSCLRPRRRLRQRPRGSLTVQNYVVAFLWLSCILFSLLVPHGHLKSDPRSGRPAMSLGFLPGPLTSSMSVGHLFECLLSSPQIKGRGKEAMAFTLFDDHYVHTRPTTAALP